jgi:hypothetical protein
MLTRDIELADSILDLIDNCLDGIQREISEESSEEETPYEGYWVKLQLSRDGFEIEDNCGGIPIDLAEKKAFRLGRPKGAQPQSNDSSIGMYGIGMKRAIFKMGRSASIRSWHDEAFEVVITPEWLSDEEDWNLPLVSPKTKPEIRGTHIYISDLYQGVSSSFVEGAVFHNDLFKYISQHYSVIINKGFKIYLNGLEVSPGSIEFRMDLSVSPEFKGEAITPYYLEANIGGVAVKIIAGLIRPVPSAQEIEENQNVKQSRDDAGWSIICNDRVVVYKDKTRLTGWGEAGVPGYHNQFIAFSGVVLMGSSDPYALPLTTTKRGVDTSSEVFLITKDYMREATKIFTDFTNRWKGKAKDLKQLYDKTSNVSVSSTSEFQKLPIRKLRKIDNAFAHRPVLPRPLLSKSMERKITFYKKVEVIEEVSAFLFERRDIDPSEVGAVAFDHIAKIANESME